MSLHCQQHRRMLHLLFRSTELTRDLATVVKPERRLEKASRPIVILGRTVFDVLFLCQRQFGWVGSDQYSLRSP